MIGPDQLLAERSLEHRLEVRITKFFEEREESLDVTLSGEGLLMNKLGEIFLAQRAQLEDTLAIHETWPA